MPDPFDCYLSSPAGLERSGLFRQWRREHLFAQSTSGALNWKFKTGDVVHASPAIADGTAASWELGQLFLRSRCGDWAGEVAIQDGGGPDTHNQVGIQSSAAVVDGMVYFGCRDSHLYALDAKTGQKKWAFSRRGSLGWCRRRRCGMAECTSSLRIQV